MEERINQQHPLTDKSVISTYRLGNENVYTYGEVRWNENFNIDEWEPVEGKQPINFEVIQLKVDGMEVREYSQNFDNLADAIKLHYHFYSLLLTEEQETLFSLQAKEELRKKFDELKPFSLETE